MNQTFVARARAAWGEALPDWVLVLAEEADRTSGAAAARRIGYSAPVVSQVIGNAYAGALDRVAGRVAGVLQGATVFWAGCPLGEIPRHRCLDEQAQPFRATSALRVQLYRACRSGCPHSTLPSTE